MALLVNNYIIGICIEAIETKLCKPVTAMHVSIHWSLVFKQSNIHQRSLLLLLLLLHCVCRYIEISRGALATPAVGKQHAELLPNATGEASFTCTSSTARSIGCGQPLCWLLYTVQQPDSSYAWDSTSLQQDLEHLRHCPAAVIGNPCSCQCACLQETTAKMSSCSREHATGSHTTTDA
jgi:hypothetical protein